MAGMGIPEDQMVAAVKNPETGEPISPVTLRKHFRKELDEGFVQANAKVGLSLYKNATTATETYPGGIPVAQLFWLKCRARWQQNPERNPPPPPAPGDEKVDRRDLVRRIAFTLRRHEHEIQKEAPPPASPKKKKVATPA
jgi:hypothetical protein